MTEIKEYVLYHSYKDLLYGRFQKSKAACCISYTDTAAELVAFFYPLVLLLYRL